MRPTKTPSVKSLKGAFPNQDSKLIKLLLIDDEAVEKYAEHYRLLSQYYNEPSARYKRMLALNHALDMYGVVHIGQFGEKGFYYLNTGDAYAATLIQFDGSNAIILSSWGDIVERGNYK